MICDAKTLAELERRYKESPLSHEESAKAAEALASCLIELKAHIEKNGAAIEKQYRAARMGNNVGFNWFAD